jgi:sugar fermentation stimulation protein A
MLKTDGAMVGVNTHLTNKIVNHALENNLIKDFSKRVNIKSEQVFGSNTRFDFYLEDKKTKIFLEVKSVTLKRKDKTAEFPDSVTSRGTKHLNELINATKKGFKAYLLFVIQRNDCDKFEIAKDIDPVYSKTLIKALKNKVKILCYDCKFSSKGIVLNNKIRFQIND